jgi:hypothetical protein
MIHNLHLDRLMEVETVRSFTQKYRMQTKLCTRNEDSVFLLYRSPYVIGFREALIENYLEIFLIDMNADLLLTEGSLIFCSVELGHQSREKLRTLDFSGHEKNDIFLSQGPTKMYGLQTTLEALDSLLPLIETKGGLTSMQNGTFDSRFDFSDLVTPTYANLKEMIYTTTSMTPSATEPRDRQRGP